MYFVSQSETNSYLCVSLNLYLNYCEALQYDIVPTYFKSLFRFLIC
jgi:hypothetical protein